MTPRGSIAPARWAIAAVVIPLLVLAGLSFFHRAAALHGEDGVVWAERVSGVEAVRVSPGSPADLAGILSGDRLLSIEAVEVTHAQQVAVLLWGRGGIPTTYRVLRADRAETRRLIPLPSGEENRVFYYLCVVGILALGAGALAAWKLPGEPASRPLFLLTVALYLILVFSPSGRAGAIDWAFYWGDLAGRLAVPPLLIHFILRVGEETASRRGRPHRLVALYLPALLLLGLNFYLIPLRGALRFPDPFGAVRVKDRLEILYLALLSSAAVVLLLTRLWTATRARLRWRLRWVALSAAAGLFPICILYLIPKAIGLPTGAVGEIAVFPLALAPLGFAAALFQERTVDLDQTLRGAVRVALGGAALLGGGLALSWALGNRPGGRPDAGVLTEVILPLAGSALLTILLRRPMRRLADRMLGRTPPETARALVEFRTVLNGELHLEVLSRRFLRRLEEVLGLERAVLLVREGSQEEFRPVPAADPPGFSAIRIGPAAARRLAARESILLAAEGGALPAEARERLCASGGRYLFPMSVHGDLKAMLVVGFRRDGSPLGSSALEVIAALAAQAARSVDGARLYREIEERVAVEKRLRARSQGILEASRIGILLADGDGKVTAANRAAGEILGRHDLTDAPLEEVLPRGLLLLLDRRGRRVPREGGGGRVFRYSFGTADGRTRIINVTRAPLSGETGPGRVYTIDDVTEEVLREEKVLRQEHLASVGLLASQVAHEVTTPLTGIASYAQILMSRLSSRLPEMDLLRKIEAQAFRAAGIAGSVLNFARRREGEPPQTFEPGEVIAECLTLFEPHLKGRRIRMTMERAAPLPLIRGHRGRVQQIVMNLLLNAADALPGGGEVRLEIDRQDGYLRLRVSDNGVGIPADVLPRIFEPFFTARPDGKGTGLGLAVVRQIVREHGGELRVESIPQSGTTFTVLLPGVLESSVGMARGA